MDFFRKLFGWEKPEELVLGAELKCPYGSRHSFLILPIREMDNGKLPCGCVKDCKAGVNIFPFGECKEGAPCEELMDLADEWENLEPQGMLINGEEAITTASILMCKKCGVGIEAVTSGQDGVMSGKWIEGAILLGEIVQKYPGLLGVITGSGGSVYLDGEMYKDAINFLEDCIERNGGEIDIGTLSSPRDLESTLIQKLMDLLLPGCDASNPDGYMSVLEEAGLSTGICELPGWDAHKLNKETIQMLRILCEEKAKEIETSAFARFPEEHKKGMRLTGKVVLEIGNTLVLIAATLPEDAFEKTGEGKGKWLEKLKAFKNAGKSKSGTVVNTLTDAQKSRINSLKNIIKNNLKETDFSGTLRDLQGNPVRNPQGGYYDHLTEMKQSYRALEKIKRSLEGSLQNPNLSGIDREILRKALEKANFYIQKIEKLFEPFGGVK